MQIGGPAEGYMDAPTLNVQGGGVSPIAAIFDLLGLNRMVSKGPKPGKETPQDLRVKDATPAKGEGSAPATSSGDTKMVNPKAGAPEFTPKLSEGDLNMATPPARESDFVHAALNKPANVTPETDWSRRWLSSLVPLAGIDPNSAFGK